MCWENVDTFRIRNSHQRSCSTYGCLCIHADLVAEGWRVSGKRVARLMRAEGLGGISRRKGRITTMPEHSQTW